MVKGFLELTMLFFVERQKRRSGKSAGEPEAIERRLESRDAESLRDGVVWSNEAPLERSRFDQIAFSIQR